MAGTDYINNLLRLHDAQTNINDAIESLEKVRWSNVILDEDFDKLTKAQEDIKVLANDVEKLRSAAFAKLIGGNG